MKRYTAKPIVGAFLKDEPRAILELNKYLRDISEPVKAEDYSGVSITEIDSKEKIYAVSIEGRTPVLLQAVEVLY